MAKYTLIHPNGRGNGSTAIFERTEVGVFITIQPHDSSCSDVSFAANIDDICKVLQVLRGEYENVGNGAGIMQNNERTKDILKFEHRLMDNGEYCGFYMMEIVNIDENLKCTSAHISIKSHEALGISIALERCIADLTLGRLD